MHGKNRKTAEQVIPSLLLVETAKLLLEDISRQCLSLTVLLSFQCISQRWVGPVRCAELEVQLLVLMLPKMGYN